MEKTVYTNGNIITMDSHFPKTEAVLVEGGRIRACGEKGELLQDRGHIRVFDLQGATLMPRVYRQPQPYHSIGPDIGMCCPRRRKKFSRNRGPDPTVQKGKKNF